MIYSVWVSLLLAIPALCLQILPRTSQARQNYWALFWTFAYAAYLVHFYYAVFVHYHGSFREMWAQQGWKIGGPNLLLTAWWGFDVLLGWSTDSSVRWIRIQRDIAHFLAFAIFLVSSVIIFKGPVNVFGYLMIAVVAVSFLIRFSARPAARLAQPATAL